MYIAVTPSQLNKQRTRTSAGCIMMRLVKSLVYPYTDEDDLV